MGLRFSSCHLASLFISCKENLSHKINPVRFKITPSSRIFFVFAKIAKRQPLKISKAAEPKSREYPSTKALMKPEIALPDQTIH